MKIKLIIPITLALMTSPGMAQSNPEHTGHRAHGHAERMLNHMDDDGDNLISIEEFRSPTSGMFKHFEFGEDGITLDELQRQFEERLKDHATRAEKQHQRMLDHFAEWDLDGNGSVTPDEIKLARFNRMDENNDGYISADEIKPLKRGDRRRHRFPQNSN